MMLMTGCREKKRKRVTSSLNQDVIFTILTKLPSKSLIRFRSACKSWDSMISDRYFINSHLQQQQRMPRLLVLECVPETSEKSWIRFTMIESGPQTTIDFLFDKEIPGSNVLARAHHCDGLLVYQTHQRSWDLSIHLCNPSTREMISLPMSGRHDYYLNMRNKRYRDSIGFGFDRSLNKYKIVRNFYEYAKIKARTYSMLMEVFTLGGASNTWKLLKRPPYPVCYKRPASAHGAVYWKVWNAVHTLPPRAILRFDLSDEKFRLIDPPPPFESDPLGFERRATLMDIQDNLFCVHSAGRHGFYLWMLSKEEKWTQSYKFKLPPGIRGFDNIAIHRGKLFLTISSDLYVLNPETNSLSKIMSSIGQILTCVERLTPIGGNY